MASDFKRIRDDYRTQFLKFGDTPRGVFWNDLSSQQLRFAQIIGPFAEHLGSSDSLHDVGCGVGALKTYLDECEVKCVYSGSDLVPDMIERAKVKFPDASFSCRDIIDSPPSERYDYVVCSGAFNLFSKTDNWEERVKERLLHMYKMCNKALSVNFLTTFTTFRDESLFYFDPKVAIEFCVTQMSRFFVLNQSYPLYEYSITVFRPEWVQSLNSSEDFQKYFPKLET